MIDTLDMTFRTLTVSRSVDCPVCGDDPSVIELIDYEQFCGMPSFDEHATENVSRGICRDGHRQWRRSARTGEGIE